MPDSFWSTYDWKKGIFNGVEHRYLSIKPRDASRETFVLLHNFPLGPLTFSLVLPDLVKQGYGVLLPEMVAYGESAKFEATIDDNTVYAMQTLVNYVIAIMDHERVEQGIIFGHDFGSPVGSRLYNAYPERVKALVLAAIPYPYPSKKGMFERKKQLSQYITSLGLDYQPFGYQKLFMRPDAADLLSANAEQFLNLSVFAIPEVNGQPSGKYWVDEGALEAAIKNKVYLPEDIWVQENPDLKRDLIKYLKPHDAFKYPLMWYYAQNSATTNRSFELQLLGVDPDQPDDGKTEREIDGARIKVPFFFARGEYEAITPKAISDVQNAFTNEGLYTEKAYPAGHYLLYSHAKQVMVDIFRWLDGLKAGGQL